MKIFPAIDLYGGQAVRLLRGDYDQMTVYRPDGADMAREFARQGARCLHLVDLEGARDGGTPNLNTVERIVRQGNFFTQIGGGIRSMETVERYLSIGVDRVILGTAAVTDEDFLRRALDTYGDKIAVGVDIRDGLVAIRGWRETSRWAFETFCRHMEQLGVATLICTDISKDGAMEGTNRALYAQLSQTCPVQLIASGGVSSLEDIRQLREMGLYGAIVGRACYTGDIDLKQAMEVAT